MAAGASADPAWASRDSSTADHGPPHPLPGQRLEEHARRHGNTALRRAHEEGHEVQALSWDHDVVGDLRHPSSGASGSARCGLDTGSQDFELELGTEEPDEPQPLRERLRDRDRLELESGTGAGQLLRAPGRTVAREVAAACDADDGELALRAAAPEHTAQAPHPVVLEGFEGEDPPAPLGDVLLDQQVLARLEAAARGGLCARGMPRDGVLNAPRSVQGLPDLLLRRVRSRHGTPGDQEAELVLPRR